MSNVSIISSAHAEAANAASQAAPKMDPMHHFLVHKVVPLSFMGFDFSVTNSVIWMWISVAAAFFFFRFAFAHAATDPRKGMVPGRLQGLAEITYLFVRGMVKDNIGKEGMRYFPGVLALFLFIVFCNLLGLIPHSYTPTSQIIVTAALSVSVFLFATGLGFYKHGAHYLHFFVPTGVPIFLLPLMVPIEVISYLARPVSLAVRLFANMTAGHTILGVLFFFSVTVPLGIAWVPFGFTIVFNAFEIFIAIVQAYIFTILTCVYINDALHMH